jgi:hypothetical protein
MSYPWANDLIYRMTGNPVPPKNNLQLAARQPAVNGERNHDGSSSPGTSSPAWNGLDALRGRAMRRVPEWQVITLRLPAASDPNATSMIDSGTGGRPTTLRNSR